MSLFSSRKPRGRQFRKKVVHTLDESDEGEQQGQEKNGTEETVNPPVQNIKKKKEVIKPTTTKVGLLKIQESESV